ncbi:MAG TPA: LuxR C-terminal-related transcriptional regulator [Solirubrobacteraceae bacterium]|nr:LuxR C-terminal-related transcriptional regulator [Solirubrobacteraceae bacterium]
MAIVDKETEFGCPARATGTRRGDLERVRRSAADALADHREPSDALRAVDALVLQVRERLQRATGTPARLAELAAWLLELGSLDGQLREHAARAARARQVAVRSAMRRLAALGSPSELIDAAPVELCRSCGFSRAMISRVRGSLWVPDVLHVESGVDPNADIFFDFVATAEIPLSHMVLESELVRKRTAVLVLDPRGDPRTHKAIVAAARSPSYVASPITSGGRVIGFLHADRFGITRAVDASDRDALSDFADHFGPVFERAVLLERLATQREEVRRAFAWAEQALGEISGELALDNARPAPREAPPPGVIAASAAGAARLESLLTAREREVLDLMARGARNRQIAERLVISEGTVKSHVKNILRKLRAANRAEAVARYVRLSGRAPERR